MTIRTGIITVATALLIAAGAPAPASGQSDTTPAAAIEKGTWAERFGEQVRQILNTGDPERQSRTLQLVLQYAKRPDLNIDFGPAVPALLDVYENAEKENLRIMAVNALSMIGGEPVMARMADRVRFEKSDRVRRHTLRVLKVRQLSRKGMEM